MISEYWHHMVQLLADAGAPSYAADDLTADTMAHLDDMAPPKGGILLATSEDGALLGCGFIRKIRPDAAEFKRMYVRPKARGLGIGRRLFELRVKEAQRMGCKTLYADTVKGNTPMLSMYEKFGFTYIPRYPENANSPELEPYLVYLRRDIT
ncbi:GNAT family N-acetyltransferase [Yoonia sp. GPGPB17]|uniref:GNAT family N-acetyltransferase n=1 Tax=Yoonia sp. GPGPB17 TaxID=3026147 RepID=UPI0030BE1B3D